MEQGSAFDGDDVAGARLLFVDMRVRSLLLREARRAVVTRMFGIPREDQSFLVTIIVLGSAAAAVRGLVVRPLLRPSGGDLAIGGAVVDTVIHGIAGPPSRVVPLAGPLIAFALLARSLRPAVAGSVRGSRGLARGFGAVLGVRHG
jgi:hypothetical protein